MKSLCLLAALALTACATTTSASPANDNCAKAWPPFAVADASKANAQFKVITRKDGTKQWSFNGQPLYYYAGDSAPGEMSGEGSGGVWYVIRSAPKPAKASSSGY